MNQQKEAESLNQRFHAKYFPAFTKKFGSSNPNQIPVLKKVVVNVGAGEAVQNPKALSFIEQDLRLISGQKPVLAKAKKSIANFKLRAGMPIGAYVTLRGDRMYDFIDRLIKVALPRVRDFKGVSTRAFDGKGTYTLGIKEQIVFTEIDYDKTDKVRGLSVSLVTNATKPEHVRFLMEELGFPFRKN